MDHAKKTVLLLVLVLAMLMSSIPFAEADSYGLSGQYDHAQYLMSQGDYTEAAEAFALLGSYEDARKLTMYCRAVAAAERGDYDIAFASFALLGDYKDCVLLTTYYQGRQQETGGWRSKLRAAEIYDGIALFWDSQERALAMRESCYRQAFALFNSGDTDRALAVFNSIKGYKDVDSLLANDHDLAAAAAAAARDAKFSVGNLVTFGHYPQTGDGNDNTPIEWLVLARDGNKALLISRYGLDVKRYNEKRVDITWEKCTLRTWLNGTFLNKAFTAEEQKGILLTNVDNGSSQGYSWWSTSGGNNTQDRVFLLSYAEANEYFGVTNSDSNNTKSWVAPTAYAIKQGAYASSSNKTADGTAAGCWWLRSPGSNQSRAAIVFSSGSLYDPNVNTGSTCVRPALWINLKSGVF